MKNLSLIILVLFCISNTYAQIGIKASNTAPIASAQLEVQSTTKAFYPPRMTTQQRTTMPNPPLAGAVVFDTDLNGLFAFNGSSWVSGSGLTLPYITAQSYNVGELLSIKNTNADNYFSVIRAETNSSDDGDAIRGIATNTSPLNGTIGVQGINYSTNDRGYGVSGIHEGLGAGVYGYSGLGKGIFGYTNSGTAGYFSVRSSGYALITGTGNVGIGIPAPLEKLHISGNIRASSLAGTGVRDVKADANGTLVTTPQTYTVSVAPQSFQPRYNNSGTFTGSGAFGNCFMSVGSTDNLVTGIQLPNGATISSVTFYYINTDNTKKFSVSLVGSPFTFGTNFSGFDGSTSTISASGSNVLSYPVPNSGGGSVIDNTSSIYYLLVLPQTTAGGSTTWSANMSIKGVKITYTL